MNPIQRNIISLLRDQGSVALKYREIGRKIGGIHPQTVKHHLEVLMSENLIVEKNGFIALNSTDVESSDFVNLPFYGLATCGNPTIQTNDLAEGYIKLSKNILPSRAITDYYLVKATGNSMDQAQIGPQSRSIENGDLVLVNGSRTNPRDGDYVLTVIEGCANIKKIKYYDDAGQIALISESSDEFFPIILHKDDNFQIRGIVEEVIKTNF